MIGALFDYKDNPWPIAMKKKKTIQPQQPSEVEPDINQQMKASFFGRKYLFLNNQLDIAFGVPCYHRSHLFHSIGETISKPSAC
ncbi:hypothetical protein PGH43_17405 [Legionella pneumophila 130b]|nr:hypothetical protein PGH43_17405 [Legionella pneumophila 130b]